MLTTQTFLFLQRRTLALYAARLALALLLLELLTHTVYANAFARFHLWTRLPAAESHRTYHGGVMAAMAFYKLMFLWLKFVVIWRVARFFALLDGIDPPENMLRCAASWPAAFGCRLQGWSCACRARVLVLCVCPHVTVLHASAVVQSWSAAQVRVQQLRHLGLLAHVARVVQPLAHPLHVRAPRRRPLAAAQRVAHLHVCGALARLRVAPAEVGVAYGALRGA
jgi:hypothetical protein